MENYCWVCDECEKEYIISKIKWEFDEYMGKIDHRYFKCCDSCLTWDWNATFETFLQDNEFEVRKI